MNVLVFDIKTVPDTISGSRILGLQDLSDADIARALFAKQVQKSGGSDFLPLHLHRIVAISAVLRSGDRLEVWSLGSPDSPEPELVSRFYGGIERYTPTLVSWNGSGFDLPVLHFRSLLHGVEARRYWDNGDDDREFKYNNYLSRFHWRHIDLMDVLAGFNFRGNARLDEISTMLGFPGKLGMDGSKVWEAWQQGGIEEIRDYCETDVLNTYLVYLRWELVRGNLSATTYDEECEKLRAYLESEDKPHFSAFLAAWDEEGAEQSG